MKTTIRGLEMTITRDQVKTKGYRDWCPTVYMDTPEQKRHCGEWVAGLILDRGLLCLDGKDERCCHEVQ